MSGADFDVPGSVIFSGCFAVRCIFWYPKLRSYEERMTIWRADSIDRAIELAEAEAEEYASDDGCECLGFAQAYGLADEVGTARAERRYGV